MVLLGIRLVMFGVAIQSRKVTRVNDYEHKTGGIEGVLLIWQENALLAALTYVVSVVFIRVRHDSCTYFDQPTRALTLPRFLYAWRSIDCRGGADSWRAP